jgi:hypothetical protein
MTNVLTASKTTGLRDLAITWRPIEALKPYPRNARTHSKKQIREIADSISTFGWTNPVLVDGSGGIIAGHARVEAAKLLGLEKVPTIGIEDLTEAQKRAYILADNKLALNAGWDEVILAEELEGLLATEIDFGIEVTGFSIPEIDSLIEGLVPVEDGDPLEDILPDEGPPVSRVGDLWLLGPHKVLCGDALKAECYEGCCQSNANRSPKPPKWRRSGRQLTPLGQCS